MSAPPKQTKISYKKGKTEITYESNLDASQYYLYELTRAGLRDVGKFVCTKFKEMFYNTFKKHRGRGGKACRFAVISGKRTTAPRVQVGLREGKMDGFYAFYQELGSSHVPKKGILTNVVQSNVAEIVKIESQYLSGLSEEASRLDSLINENTMEGDMDGTN